MADENRDVQNIPHVPKRRRLASELELERVNRSLKDDPGCLDWNIHVRRVQQNASLKAVCRPAMGPVTGVVRRYSSGGSHVLPTLSIMPVADRLLKRAAIAVLESTATADAERRAAHGTLATFEDFENVPRLREQSGE
jgi:hypothetical protein